MQSPHAAREHVLKFIRRTIPRGVARVEKLYRDIQHESAAVEVLDQFEQHRDAMVRASSQREWLIAKQAASVVYQSAALDIRRNSGFRDEMMARNVQWLLDKIYPGRKIILWAHNGHITAGRDGAFTPGWRRVTPSTTSGPSGTSRLRKPTLASFPCLHHLTDLSLSGKAMRPANPEADRGGARHAAPRRATIFE